MYRKGESGKPEYKDEEEQEDAKKTRDSFLRSILYPQQSTPSQQQLRQQQSSIQLSQSRKEQNQLERQQRHNQQHPDKARMSTSILPSVSPQHLSLPTMVPVQTLPRTPLEHTPNQPLFSPLRNFSQRKGSGLDGRSTAYQDNLYNNLRPYQYPPGETEASKGTEIITPDLKFGEQIFGQQKILNQSPHQRRFVNLRDMKKQPHPHTKTIVRKQIVDKPDVICNCPKSRCLKLYCDCFQAGDLCNTFCHCRHCLNTSSELVPGGKLYYARKEYNKRDPNIFVTKRTTKIREGKGCSCRNSKCMKKYCICFREHIRCTEKCSCVACCNKSTIDDSKIEASGSRPTEGEKVSTRATKQTDTKE